MNTVLVKAVSITMGAIYALLLIAALYNLGLQVMPWILVTNIFTAIAVCCVVVVVAKAEKDAGRSLF